MDKIDVMMAGVSLFLIMLLATCGTCNNTRDTDFGIDKVNQRLESIESRQRIHYKNMEAKFDTLIKYQKLSHGH